MVRALSVSDTHVGSLKGTVLVLHPVHCQSAWWGRTVAAL